MSAVRALAPQEGGGEKKILSNDQVRVGVRVRVRVTELKYVVL